MTGFGICETGQSLEAVVAAPSACSGAGALPRTDGAFMDEKYGIDKRSDQCSRIRIFRFFQISKKHDFLHFFEMTSKSRKKSSAKV